jgi:hypothetical protein
MGYDPIILCSPNTPGKCGYDQANHRYWRQILVSARSSHYAISTPAGNDDSAEGYPAVKAASFNFKQG